MPSAVNLLHEKRGFGKAVDPPLRLREDWWVFERFLRLRKDGEAFEKSNEQATPQQILE